MGTPLSYAALGSSFASGPGIDPIVDAAAMRSANNYPHVLARALGADLTDLSVSGATTATILDQPQVTMAGARFAPQLDGVPPDAGLVTVTAGGNDLRYMTAMMFAGWNRVRPGGPAATMLAADLPDGPPVPSAADVERTAAGLAAIVTRVRARAPRARILLVDYLTVLGDDPAPEPFGDPLFRDIQSALESAYVTAAARSGAELVAVSAISRGHALGSAEPWIHPFTPTAAGAYSSLHPNAAGMAAVAAAIAWRLKN
ncbi:GDSL-type esterase/lipase family protein [Actinoplanes sp. NPDC023714]|uniref:GDSL-type esterase/lipase family protein n=1 Tax=Actinoplanes sp. NPDC023714 TaxID=3154322 RepID=UPI0033E0611D